MTAPVDNPQPVPAMRFVRAGPERVLEMSILHGRVFDPSWDGVAMMQLLVLPSSLALAAMSDERDELAAFVLAQVAADEAEILSIATAPEWQRRGLGRSLLDKLAAELTARHARRLFLEVAADNAAAQALYRSAGFVEVGRRKGYYERRVGPAVDAYVLEMRLG